MAPQLRDSGCVCKHTPYCPNDMGHIEEDCTVRRKPCCQNAVRVNGFARGHLQTQRLFRPSQILCQCFLLLTFSTCSLSQTFYANSSRSDAGLTNCSAEWPKDVLFLIDSASASLSQNTSSAVKALLTGVCRQSATNEAISRLAIAM